MIVAIIYRSAKKGPKVHLEIQKHRSSCYGLIRSSYREAGKIKHTNHGRITGLDFNELKLVQLAIRGLTIPKDSPEGLKTKGAKEYGASYAFLRVAENIGLNKSIYSRPGEQWVKDCMAMIVGRVIYQGSKLSLSNQWKNTVLWELCGIEGKVNVKDHCYKSMDELLKRQDQIQKRLSKKHIKNGPMILYDITSSYFEGAYSESEIVRFGYNRDQKRGRAQIVIGLICNEEGCPAGTEVFSGNTPDGQTVTDKINEAQKKYGIKELIFAGDRGMVTQANVKKLKDVEGLQLISALTHPQIMALNKRGVIQMGLFDEKDVVEVLDTETPFRRYFLCKNLDTARRETQTRLKLIQNTTQELTKIESSKRAVSDEKTGSRVGRILQKYKAGKFINWSVKEGQLTWSLDTDKVEMEKKIDGCYIIWTNVAADKLDKDEVVKAYKSLANVEMAFRNIKTVQLELRPIFHKTDNRIRAHVFICMLAYYLQWHLKRMLAPLFQADGTNENREWTFQNVIQRLSMIHKEKAILNKVEFDHISTPENDQAEILDLLDVKLPL
ncbi:MAG: IS1634 family transposase [bacterium]|nr:IS1634 family transposase [bacterium]